MCVVRGAVERVDEPRARAVGLAGEAFLSQDGVVGKRGSDDVDDPVLRGDVSPRDDRRPLALQVDLRRPSEAFNEHGPAGSRRGDRDLEQRVDGKARPALACATSLRNGRRRASTRPARSGAPVGVDHVGEVRLVAPTRGSCARRARCGTRGSSRRSPTPAGTARPASSASTPSAPCRNSSISGRRRASSSIARLGAASRLWLPIVMRISFTRGNHVASIARIGCSGRPSGNTHAVAPVVRVLLGQQDRAAGDLDVAESSPSISMRLRRDVVHRLGHARSRGRTRTPAWSARAAWSAA